MRSRPSRSRAARRRERPAEDPAVATSAALAASLRATGQGLGAFLRSLREGGLAEAIGPYRQLQVTLLQQRAWALRHGRAELDPLWRELAATAGAIHRILASFAEVMDALKEIDRIAAIDTAPAGEDAPAEAAAGIAELEALLAPLSLRRQRGDTGAAGTGLDELRRAGIVEPHGWGRGQSLRFTPAARRALAASLARLCAAGPPAAPSGED